VFLVFPKEFERNQFLMALEAAFHITYFDTLYGKLSDFHGQRADAFLVRFGRNTQEVERKGVSEDPQRKKEDDETKDQYFAILTCLKTSDVDFTYALMNLIKEIKKHDPNPALILVGTAGGPEYLKTARIQKAFKFDRGEMPDKKTIEIDTALTVSETFPGFFNGATTHCSNWLMHFSADDDYLDMESFEFCKVCKYMDIADYACVRICSDTPENSVSTILPIVKKLASNFGYDEKDIQCSPKVLFEEKQRKVLQKILRKLTDFTNAVNEVIPVLKEYTLKRIRSIPSNNYESGSEKKGRIVWFKDSLTKNWAIFTVFRYRTRSTLLAVPVTFRMLFTN